MIYERYVLQLKYQFWSFIFRCALFLIGTIFCKSSISSDQGSHWGIEGIILMVTGLGFLTIGIVISLPKIMNHSGRGEKLEKFSRYLLQTLIWCSLSMLLVELTLRVGIRNPPLRRDVTNWAGDLPAVHSTILWGREGYALTQYEKWGEIRTPYHDGKKNNDVIVLGDSQTEGLQVADDFKFPSFTETFLREDGHNVDLHNLGRSGLSIADYVSWIPPYRSLYRPKIIVIQLTESDFIDSFHEGQFNYFVVGDNKIIELFHTYDLSSGFIQKARVNYYLDPQIQGLGYERWDLMQKGNENFGDENSSPELFNPQLAEQQMEMLISVSEGVPLVAVLLPSAPYIDGDKIQTEDPTHEHFKEFIEQYPQITIIDPLPEFRQLASTGYLPRGFFNTSAGVGHLNTHGHEIVGQLLAKAIEQILK